MQTDNEREKYEIEEIKRLLAVLYGKGAVTDEEREDIRTVLHDEKHQAEITKSIVEFRSKPRDRKRDEEKGAEFYQRFMAKYGHRFTDNTPKRIPLYKRSMFRVAAALIPLLVLGGAIGLWLSGPGTTGNGVLIADSQAEAPATITVSAEESDKLIKLSDGSSIRLEPGATIEYDSDFPESRVVRLTGDAFFTVAKLDGKTFEVLHNDLTIRVLGTEFYVDGNGAITEVTLCSGSVEIDAAGGKILLEPNQQYTTDCGGTEYSVVELTAAEIARMHRGKLKLRDVSIPDAIRMIGEFFDMEIETHNLPAKGTGLIRLEFKAGDKLEDVLYSLQIASENAFDYRIEDGKTIIRGR